MALTDNIVSYWKLDESSGTAVDSVGGNDESSSSGKTYAAAKINNGASLTGSASYLRMAGTYPSGNNAVTIACWFNPSNYSGVRTMIGYGNAASAQMIGINNAGTSTIWFTSYAGDDDSGVTVSNGNWYHVVMVHNGTTQVGYVNGVAKTSRTRTLSLGSGNFVLGNFPTVTTDPFAGLIDEVGVWSRALSSTEVAELYNGGNGLSYPFTSNSGAFFNFF